MKDIVIIGAGGFALEVAFLIEEINKFNPTWNLLGFIDENVGEKNGKYQVVNTDNWLVETKNEINVAFGIGNPALLEKLSIKFSKNSKIIFPNLIHPNVIGDFNGIKFGKGNIVCAGNIFTTEINIGNFNIFNLNNTIGHNVIFGNCNVINPSCNISGGVEIYDKLLMGTGSQALQYVKITSDTIIGAGAVVVRNISEKGVYVGCPAKKIK